jgi:hypothetical protein
MRGCIFPSLDVDSFFTVFKFKYCVSNFAGNEPYWRNKPSSYVKASYKFLFFLKWVRMGPFKFVKAGLFCMPFFNIANNSSYKFFHINSPLF